MADGSRVLVRLVGEPPSFLVLINNANKRVKEESLLFIS